MKIKNNILAGPYPGLGKAVTWLLLYALIAGLGACEADDRRMFTEMHNKDTGIEFRNTLREDESANVLNYLYFYNGAGVAAGDIDNDGNVDLFFSGNMVGNRLYRNKGDFEFEDISVSSGISEFQGWCTGVSMVDINGDGWLDIYVCRSADVVPKRRQNLLFINNGNGKFTEQAAEFGLADEGYSTQASFFDFDRDGDLDMFLLNHSQQQYAAGAYENVSLRSQKNENFSSKLYRNDGGRFSDISREAGLISNVLSFGLGVAVSDLNSDGWQDIYVSNDFNEPDYLYINNRRGGFTESLASSMDQVSLFSMGSDCADVNNDGLPDLLTLDMLPEDNYMQKMHTGAENFNKFRKLFESGFFYQYSRNMLHLNNGDGSFSEIAQLAGVSNTDWSWSPLIADFDNDGRKDIFITNGYVRDYTNMDYMKFHVDQLTRERAGAAKASMATLLKEMPSVKIPNYAFQQDSSGSFINRAADWGLGKPDISAGALYADLDNDGDLDLVVSNINSPASVYRNNTVQNNTGNHWIRFRLQGAAENINAIGASVKVYAGGDIFFAEQQPVRGFQSCVEPGLHIGLGGHEKIDSIVFNWPEGQRSGLAATMVDQTLSVRSPGLAGQTEPAAEPQFLFYADSALKYQHTENPFNDFTVQTLLPVYLSRSGPCLAKGDINGDGLEDFFIGGASGQAAAIFMQTNSNSASFTRLMQPALDADAMFEDTRALFIDVDNDGDPDLVVASGGYEFSENDPLLECRLYLNDGKGHFRAAVNAFPVMSTSIGALAAADIDGDGDIDLFAGGRVVPGRFPEAPRSWILLNDGHGSFSDATGQICPGLRNIGMVTDAVFMQLDADTLPDLVVAGDWMPLHAFVNRGSSLVDQSTQYFQFPSAGCWTSLLLADLDNDGVDDLVAGNMGLNGQLRPTSTHPLSLLFKDFDGNGSVDPLLFYPVQGRSYPFASRDDLTEQLPMLNKKYLSYNTYAHASEDDLLTVEQMNGSHKLLAQTLETTLLLKKGNRFVRQALPIEVQYAPVYAMAAVDVDGDGINELVLAGNQSWARIKIGRFRANHGIILKAGRDGSFSVLKNTGLRLRADTRDMLAFKSRDSTAGPLLIFGNNDAPMDSYRLKKQNHEK